MQYHSSSRDSIFKPPVTVMDQRETLSEVFNPDGSEYTELPWVSWGGKSNSTDLIVIGYVSLKEKVVEFYGWVPWKYAVENRLLQNPFMSEKQGRKLCIYVDNVRYMQGLSDFAYFPELNCNIPLLRKVV